MSIPPSAWERRFVIDRNRTMERAAAYPVPNDIYKRFEEENQEDRGESIIRGAKWSWTGRHESSMRENWTPQIDEEDHRQYVEKLWREDTVRADDARKKWLDMEIIRAWNSGERPFWVSARGQDQPQIGHYENSHGNGGEHNYRYPQESGYVRSDSLGFGDSGQKRDHDGREAEGRANKRRRMR